MNERLAGIPVWATDAAPPDMLALVPQPLGPIYRTGRPSAADYTDAIEALEDARRQLEPDGAHCSVCGDGGHQAWECHHNPLAMARRAAQQQATWRCFHCGAEFTDAEAAAEHFGDRDDPAPACVEIP